MRCSSFVVVFGFLLLLSQVQTSNQDASRVHKVTVGSGGFFFLPNTTYASPGDIVSFEFFPTNHSINKAEYTGADVCGAGGCNPCVPYQMIHRGKTGFNSGNIKTQTLDPAELITFNLTINDTEPIFYYCDATDSCHPNGMVGVINPQNGTSQLENQKRAAVNAPYQLSLGQSFPVEGQLPSSTVSSNASYNEAKEAAGSSLNKGQIAGIVIGVIAAIVLAIVFFYLARIGARKREIVADNTALGQPPAYEDQSAVPAITGAEQVSEPIELPGGKEGTGGVSRAYELPDNMVPPKLEILEKTSSQ